MASPFSKINKALLASWARSFLAACLAQFLVLNDGSFDLGVDGWRVVISSGIAAVVPVLIRWLNPNDQAFGITK